MSNPYFEEAQKLYSQDAFSQWMGVELVDVKENYCLIKMSIKAEMINGLKTVHGGVTFSLADSALAFSSNTKGDAAVALNCYINFMKAVRLGDTLSAESILLNETRKTAVYEISVKNQDEELMATFRGTVYKIGKKVADL
ncbi:hotdog fold thioesterase [Soonwooa sp.]|uniref:PaaI family thioesterase n=1 Tax=Soonwooa sp. TaxID=1938592 RepID=UPI00289E00FA|nr:hotdog fold thioesterase [Soonwooa sp.]